MLNVVMLITIIILSAVLLSVIKLSVVLLKVVVPEEFYINGCSDICVTWHMHDRPYAQPESQQFMDSKMVGAIFEA
jgi:hypothetical protein